MKTTKNSCVGTTEATNCSTLTPVVEATAQVDLWHQDTLDGDEWRKQARRLGDGGVHLLASEIAEAFGFISSGDFVPIYMRSIVQLQETLGLSADGVYKPLRRAEDAGLLIRVQRWGQYGNAKFIVAKSPEDSRLQAVARARGALERGGSDRGRRGSIGYALSRELEQLREELAANGGWHQECQNVGRTTSDAQTDESLICREYPSVEQRLTLCCAEVPSLKVNALSESSKEGQQCERDDDQSTSTLEAPSPPRPPETSKNDLSALGRYILEKLEGRGCSVSIEQMVDQIGDFKRICADTWDVRTALSAKIHRLAAKYSGPTIMGMILSDAAELAEDHDAWAHETSNTNTADTGGSQGAERRTERGESSESGQDHTDEGSDARESGSDGEADKGGEVESPRALLEREAGSAEQTRVWRRILSELETMMSAHNFASWVEPLVCRRSSPERVELVSGDVFRQAWIHDNYADLMVQAAERAGYEEVVFELDCIDADAPDRKVWGGEIELAAAE